MECAEADGGGRGRWFLGYRVQGTRCTAEASKAKFVAPSRFGPPFVDNIAPNKASRWPSCGWGSPPDVPSVYRAHLMSSTFTLREIMSMCYAPLSLKRRSDAGWPPQTRVQLQGAGDLCDRSSSPRSSVAGKVVASERIPDISQRWGGERGRGMKW